MKSAFLPVALLFIALVLGQSAYAQKSKLDKTISEKYTANDASKLLLFNKFGDVTINTWTRNEITVEVRIEAWGKNDNDAREMLDRVKIAYGQTGNEVKFTTEIASNTVNINDKSGFQINYTVNMPVKASLELQNKYGAVNLADFAGNLSVEVSYGQLQAANISGNSAYITLKYSKGNIESIEKGVLEFKYSNGVTIGKAGSIELNDKYGGLSIQEVGSVNASIAYSSLKIEKLGQMLDLDAKYASCTVRAISSGFESVEVINAYGTVNLGFEPSVAFAFDVEIKFGNFKHELQGIDMQKEVETSTSATYQGTKGKNTRARVRVESSFGSVKFQ